MRTLSWTLRLHLFSLIVLDAELSVCMLFIAESRRLWRGS